MLAAVPEPPRDYNPREFCDWFSGTCGPMENEVLIREYYAIFETVNDFDKRLMTIKGLGVTLSLAALAGGFQFGHYGLFLVGAISGLAFWLIEGVVKKHQMRFYRRMREIEVIQCNASADEKS